MAGTAWTSTSNTWHIILSLCTPCIYGLPHSLEKTICNFLLSISCITACILVAISMTFVDLNTKSPLE